LLSAQGKQGNDARLTALRVVGTHPKRGRIWLTECECGNHREVAASEFTSGRIQKCEVCVPPAKLASQKRLNAAGRRRRNEFYPSSFKESWCAIRDEFSPLRYLLYEATMGDRERTKMNEFEAAYIAHTTPDAELDIEIGSFGTKRIAESIKRTMRVGYDLRGVSPKDFIF
jgi:hypothetical protein